MVTVAELGEGPGGGGEPPLISGKKEEMKEAKKGSRASKSRDVFRPIEREQKYLMDYMNNSHHLAENMFGCLSADIICSERRTVFRERSSRKTVSYEEEIISKDKYPSTFSLQMEAIVFIILQIFFRNARNFQNWGIFNN